jgi:hypothetical protein
MPARFTFMRLSPLGAVISVLFLSGIIIGLSMWLAPSSSAAGTTYHVATNGSDNNSCSAAQSANSPKRSIQAGIDCAANAGDIVVIHAGTYNQDFSASHSGSPGNPIVIQNFGYTGAFDGSSNPVGDQVLISSTSGNHVLTIQDQSYVRFQGLRFENNNSVQFMATINASNKAGSPVKGIEFVNNTFRNNGTDGSGSFDITFTLAWGDTGCTPSACVGGDLSRVDGNKFLGNYGYQVNLSGATDLHIGNNLFSGGHGSRNGSNGNTYGAAAIALGRGTVTITDRVVIDANEITGFSAPGSPEETNGIRMDSCHGSPTTEALNIVVSNNLIHDIRSHTFSGNTQSYGIFPEAGCGGLTIKNNIIYNIGGPAIQLGSQATGGPGSRSGSNGAVIDGNVLYGCYA